MANLEAHRITTDLVQAEYYTQGAHITQWTPAGQRPVLFTSSRSAFSAGKAIRGGVPIIFPWFGPRGGGLPGPAHGFARTSEWKVESSGTRAGGAQEVRFSLTSEDGAWQVRFAAVFGRNLEMQLDVKNTSSASSKFEEALHTYFAVGDIHKVSVTGLENTVYIDKTDGFKEKHQQGTVLIAKETDSVYLNTTSTCVIHDPVWARNISVEKSGSHSTVVWNPWIEKTKGMSDMAPDEWLGFICVESANAGPNAVTLAAGESHVLRVVISLG